MDPYALGAAAGQLILLLLFILPAFFFLVTQQKTLQSVRREYRELRPGLVWLQLVPLFNLYWMFVVVTRIADSISKELVALQDNSILGIPDFDAVQAISNRPTYKIGMAWCLLCLSCPVASVLVNVISAKNSEGLLQVFLFLSGLLFLAAVVCWIIYWVKLAENKRKLQRLQF